MPLYFGTESISKKIMGHLKMYHSIIYHWLLKKHFIVSEEKYSNILISILVQPIVYTGRILMFFKFLKSLKIIICLNLLGVLTIKNCCKNSTWSPGWCGSVDWVLACEPKGHQFNSQSRAHACVAGQVSRGGHVRGNHILIFPSLSSPFSKNI